ncbi:MAG: NTP transferase domain-containing protein [Proteobacteria bacterium]|nr:NTP transferase domain-containing protein [Pseudomonadota bacterium]
MNTEKKPVLLILAAGIGSRYGGVKQLDGFGPNGETIMEYSLHDAINAGFKRVVFVINKCLEELFTKQIISKYQDEIEIATVHQELDLLPKGFAPPTDRQKPWGTAHAILTAKNSIDSPFAVINADDFYGPEAFKIMANKLATMSPSSSDFFLMGYILSNTLSDYGSVSRGLCKVKNGFLSSIEELTKITKTKDGITFQERGKTRTISPDSVVSMNFWGFSPKIFEILEKRFELFLEHNSASKTAEFFIADPLDYAVKNNQIRIELLTTSEKWLGITYASDKKMVINGIQHHIDNGSYPENLKKKNTIASI